MRDHLPLGKEEKIEMPTKSEGEMNKNTTTYVVRPEGLHQQNKKRQ